MMGFMWGLELLFLVVWPHTWGKTRVVLDRECSSFCLGHLHMRVTDGLEAEGDGDLEDHRDGGEEYDELLNVT